MGNQSPPNACKSIDLQAFSFLSYQDKL